MPYSFGSVKSRLHGKIINLSKVSYFIIYKGPPSWQDIYGLCSPVKENETHFNYGIGIIIDENTNTTELNKFLNNGYSIWETNPADYAVFRCIGSDGECIGETWDKFFKEFIPQTGYIQTEDTDFEIYFENGESGLFCELWVPVNKI